MSSTGIVIGLLLAGGWGFVSGLYGYRFLVAGAGGVAVYIVAVLVFTVVGVP